MKVLQESDLASDGKVKRNSLLLPYRIGQPDPSTFSKPRSSTQKPKTTVLKRSF